MNREKEKQLAGFMQQVVALAKAKKDIVFNQHNEGPAEQAPLPEATTPTEMAIQAAEIVNKAILRLKEQKDLDKMVEEVKQIIRKQYASS